MGCTACRYNSTIGKAICSKCNTEKGFTLNAGVCSATTITCLSNQTQGTNAQGFLDCIPCPQGCLTCFQEKGVLKPKCKQCAEKFIFNEKTLDCAVNTTAFQITCNDGQRIDFASNKCMDCPAGCTKCRTSATSKFGFECGECVKDTHVFLDGFCLIKCQDKEMPVFQADLTQVCK